MKAIELCKQTYKLGASINNLDLEQRANLVAENLKSLQQSRSNLITVPTKAEAQLQKVADKCLTEANKLQIELAKMKKEPGDGLTGSVKKMSKTWSHRKVIEDVERKMRAYQTILHTHILSSMSREQAAFIIDQQDCFEQLDVVLRTFLQRFVDGCKSLSELITAEESQTRLAIVQNSQRVRDHVDDRFGALRNDQTSDMRRQRLLGSLKFPEMNFRRNDIEDSHEGTFDFVFSDSKVQQLWSSLSDFLRGEGTFYWIHGKPGSGKSTLMKLIDDDNRTTEALTQWRPNQKILRMSFFFWLVGANALQRSSRGLWCSLLHQLLSQDTGLIDCLHSRERKLTSKDSIDDWSVAELSNTFFTAMKLRSSPAFILLDGLDEFDPKEGAVEIVKWVKELSIMPQLKLLASSRPEFEIKLELETTFPAIPQMRLQDLTRADITKYVDDYFQEATKRSQLGRIDKMQVQMLNAEVVDKADGVFIWVRYVLKSLIYGAKRCSTWEELQQHLKRCPTEIHDLYREMWRRQNPDEEIYQEEAAMYFYMATQQPWGARRHRGHSNFSVFDVMLASNQKIQNKILSKEEKVPLSELIELCNNTEERLAVRCAGLLQILNNHIGVDFEKDESDDEPVDDQTLWKYIKKHHISVIHRSVHDFLTGTPEGRQILSFFQPTREQWLRTSTRLNMDILLTLGWENGYYREDIIDDIRVISTWRDEDRSPPDDAIVEMTQTIVSCYAKALNLKKDKAALQWNFSLTKLEGYSSLIGYIQLPFVDTMGLVASLGIMPFMRSFVQQAGRGRKLRTEYIDYLLFCACTCGYPVDFRRSHSGFIPWLLNLEANPNKRQYYFSSLPLRLGNEQRLAWVSTTPFLSFIELLTRSTGNSEPEDISRALRSILHQLISAGANLREHTLTVLAWSGPVMTLAPRYRYPLEGAEVLVEIQAGELLADFFERCNQPPYPSDQSHRAINDTRKIRFVSKGGRVWQPSIEEAALILSACDRFVQSIQERMVTSTKDILDDSELEQKRDWDEHVEKIMVEVLPRCKEVNLADVRTWLVENGWLAPDGYVPSPLDVDHPFEED
ncbi:MAG: hypothetical protein Q9160_009355 [Pyrenula sp. 1 TL-2023]